MTKGVGDIEELETEDRGTKLISKKVGKIMPTFLIFLLTFVKLCVIINVRINKCGRHFICL